MSHSRLDVYTLLRYHIISTIPRTEVPRWTLRATSLPAMGEMILLLVSDVVVFGMWTNKASSLGVRTMMFTWRCQ